MTASLQLGLLHHHHHPFPPSYSPFRRPDFKLPLPFHFKIRSTGPIFGYGGAKIKRRSLYCSATANSNSELDNTSDRPPFDINLAVILAGFAFEAYTTPPDNLERQEFDSVGCKTVYLSESFVREIYDGQLFIKLKRGFDFPAMDPWGTSDPYIVMELDGQIAKSKIKWGTKEPTWDEKFNINIKLPPLTLLQVAAWDANLVTPHKRMGNTGLNLVDFCDGDLSSTMRTEAVR